MPYALSFAPDFFWGNASEVVKPSSRPTSVRQAVLSLQQQTWDALAQQVFGLDGSKLDLETVLAKIAETNTCRNLDPPVEVFIDADGDFSVLVYDVTEPV
jgi:hypothetical protein